MKFTRTIALLVACAPATALAGPAENEAVARRAVEQVLGQGRFEIILELFHPDYVFHSDDGDYRLASVETNMRDLRTAFPDLAVRVDRAVASGDLVAIHWSGAGTNTRRAAGFPGTGRQIRLSGMAFVRFRDGRMIEEWGVNDNLALVRQLGLAVTPAPQQP
jgi:steroid delta-isomerase-like uncharacterized protein